MDTFPDYLSQGYRRFRTTRLAAERERYRTLAEAGQKPRAMVIGCCDSRVAPEVVFDVGPGELFVFRSVANLVPPFAPSRGYQGTGAALEFAVQGLKVGAVVVLGHGRCGGIAAALESAAATLSPDDFVGRWMDLAAPTVRALESGGGAEDRQTALERLSVAASLDNLRSYPFVAAAEREGTLAIHGAWFDIASGDLWTFDAGRADWSPLGASDGGGTD
ncbi:MAG: carbonic anhydrase [Alphaproteobacteria bacterium]|nr:carbonic anhydrase [Alphaproteobacteria bacterium]